jgi:tetratricopeptide (TPR) repeat protein
VIAAFLGLKEAAADAERVGYAQLPEERRQSAKLALAMSGLESAHPERTDWMAVATALENQSAHPSETMNLTLAMMYALAGRDRLALVETELIDLAGLAQAEQRYACRAARGLSYQLNDLPLLAAREFERASQEQPDTGRITPEMQAGVHLLLAYVAAEKRQWPRADLEVMRASRLWPNNPFAVLLTGEIRNAQGEYEKTAAAYENLTPDDQAKDNAWVVGLMQKRAREIRDADGPVEPLFCDPEFVRLAVVEYARAAAKRSPACQTLSDHVEASRALLDRCLEALPRM